MKDKVSYTAKYTAYLKSISDIPYADSMAKAINAKSGFQKLSKGATQAMLIKAPIFEARFKLITDILYQLKVKNVLELTSGFDTRGLIMTTNPEITYIETDLPEIIALKKKITTHILKKPRKNLREISLDFKDSKKMASIVDKYLEYPLAIVNVGMLTYFDKKQKMALARTIRKILMSNPHGGFWITPDFYARRELAQSTTPKENRKHMKQMNEFVGFNKLDLTFRDDKERQEFFKRAGFQARAVPFLKIQNKLSSPKKLKLSREQTKRILGNRKVFILKPKIS